MGYVSALDAILKLNGIKGKSDKETLVNIKRVIDIMEGKSNKKWPCEELCKIVYKMENEQKRIFLEVLEDMVQGLEEMGV